MTPITGISEVPDRIVSAATALFSRRGYHETSTREIARLADVSEVTVFRHFACKEEIFLSALQSSFRNVKPRLELLTRCADRYAPEAMLAEIVRMLVDIASFSPDVMRLIAVSFLELHGKAEDVCYQHLVPLFTTIAGYLTTNMEKGRLRSLDPGMVTAAIALTVIAQPELAKLISSSDRSWRGKREAMEEFSAFWVKVLVPSQQEQA